jgi:hypothetical protein
MSGGSLVTVPDVSVLSWKQFPGTTEAIEFPRSVFPGFPKNPLPVNRLPATSLPKAWN